MRRDVGRYQRADLISRDVATAIESRRLLSPTIRRSRRFLADGDTPRWRPAPLAAKMVISRRDIHAHFLPQHELRPMRRRLPRWRQPHLGHRAHGPRVAPRSRRGRATGYAADITHAAGNIIIEMRQKEIICRAACRRDVSIDSWPATRR